MQGWAVLLWLYSPITGDEWLRELAPNPYDPPAELAPNPYNPSREVLRVNLLAPNPYASFAALAPSPYAAGGDPIRERGLAPSPYAKRHARAELAPSPYVPARIFRLAPNPY